MTHHAPATFTGSDGVVREVKASGTKLVGLTPFASAVMTGDANFIDKFLIHVTVDDVNFQDGEGNTALHYAMLKHSSRKWVIERLLRAGADTNIFNNAGQKPLAVLIQGQLAARGI